MYCHLQWGIFRYYFCNNKVRFVETVLFYIFVPLCNGRLLTYPLLLFRKTREFNLLPQLIRNSHGCKHFNVHLLYTEARK
jgi:hypothetical protein